MPTRDPHPTPPYTLQIFRFRPLDRSTRPLRNAEHYELLRYFLASGSIVGHTFYGPMAFDSFGQNQGREPSTMQVSRQSEIPSRRTSSPAAVWTWSPPVAHRVAT